MGDGLKMEILARNGIISEHEIKQKPSIHVCPRCELVNGIDNKYCSKCSYPLTPQKFEDIKNEEDIKLKILEEKHSKEIQLIREEMEENFQRIFSKIDIGKLT